MSPSKVSFLAAACLVLSVCFSSSISAQTKKPNIVVIMGDDIGWYNTSNLQSRRYGLPDAEH